MKRFKLTLALLCCLPMMVFATKQKPLMDIQQWKTTKGIPVYFIQTSKVPIVDIGVIFSAGSRYDGLHDGLANLTGALLSEGTKTHSANQIAESFASAGGLFNVSTTQDATKLSLRSLTKDDYLKKNMRTYLDVLTQPKFDPTAVGRIKKQALTMIKIKQQSPGSVANDLFMHRLYGNGPYGHPVLGYKKTLTAINAKAVQQFYQHYFVAENAVITLVGDLTAKQAKQLANAISQQLPKGKKAPSQPMAKPVTQAELQHVTFKSRQSSVVLGQLGVTPNVKNKAALSVGNFILGDPGLVSELATALREKRGWVYGVYSRFKALDLKGPFYIVLQTKASQTQPALKLTRSIVTRLVNNGPTDKQVAFAKRSMIGAFPLGMSSNAQLSGLLGRIAFYHLPLNYYDQYLQQLKQVKTADVKQALKTYIQPDKMIAVIVGPEKKHGSSQS